MIRRTRPARSRLSAGHSAKDHFAAELEADPAFLGPADEGVDRAAALEGDLDALAEAGLDVAFDHGAAGGDVDHRDPVVCAAEGKDGDLFQAFVTRLRSPLDWIASEGVQLRCDRKAPSLIFHRTALPGRCDYARQGLPNSLTRRRNFRGISGAAPARIRGWAQKCGGERGRRRLRRPESAAPSALRRRG